MSAPSGFLSKTYDIISDEKNHEYCDWGPNGDLVNIKKIEEFSKIVLPKYFKHSNFQSFVRQLNMYDFRKVIQDPSNGEFQHEYFRKGHPELLTKMKRKANYRDSNKSKSSSSNNSNKKANSNSNNDDNNVAIETDDVLNELVQHRMVREEMERRISELEKKSDKVDQLEQQQRITSGENFVLKRMVTEAKQAQFVLQDKMERLMRAMYAAYVANQQGNTLPNPGVLSTRALPNMPNISNMGSSFHDVCGFLQLESPVPRDSTAATSRPQLVGSTRKLLSPPTTSSIGSSSTSEHYNFDNIAGSVAPPLGFSSSDNVVVPLVELPPTPAPGDVSQNTNDSEINKKEKSTKTNHTEIVSNKRKLTQQQAEQSLKLDMSETDAYEQFLKRARLNADSVTERAKSTKAKDGKIEVDPTIGLDILKRNQNDTLERIDSLESTLEAIIDLSDTLLDDQALES